MSNCCDFLCFWLECGIVGQDTASLHDCWSFKKMPDCEFGRMCDGINEVMQDRKAFQGDLCYHVDVCQKSGCDWLEAAISWCTIMSFLGKKSQIP